MNIGAFDRHRCSSGQAPVFVGTDTSVCQNRHWRLSGQAQVFVSVKVLIHSQNAPKSLNYVQLILSLRPEIQPAKPTVHGKPCQRDRLSEMHLHHLDDYFSPCIYRRQVSVCQTNRLYVPHVRFPDYIGLSGQQPERCPKLPPQVSMDFHPVCLHGGSLHGDVTLPARARERGRNHSCRIARQGIPPSDGALLVSAYADSVQPHLLHPRFLYVPLLSALP